MQGHDQRPRCRGQAGVAVPADETTAWDELRASAGDRSEPVALLHRWRGLEPSPRRTEVSSCISSRLSALRFSGRLSVILAAAPPRGRACDEARFRLPLFPRHCCA